MKDLKGLIGAIALAVFFILLIILICACTVRIPAGYVAVKYNMNGGVQDDVLTQGWHIVSPMVHTTNYTVGIEQSYLTSDDRGDSEKDESFIASSSEGKAITIELTFTYQYDATRVAEIFTKFKGQSGKDVRDSFIKPNIISWTKEIIAKYKVADILGEKRADVNADITNYLSGKFESYGIIISNVSLIDVSVDEQTEKAINDKIKAQQDSEKQAIENQMNIDMATAEAEAARIKAQGEADALLIEAEAEAEANAKISESLTDNIIQKEYIEKWDGKVPTVQTSNGTILDIGNIE